MFPADLPSRRRPLHRRAMHWIRRLHLYSGLCMFPWVILYGATALLFNHPGAFPDQQQTSFGVAEIQGTPLETLPPPDELARKVVAALESRTNPTPAAESSFRLPEQHEAAFNRDSVFARMNVDGNQHFIRVAVLDGTGQVSTRASASQSVKAPFAQRGLTVTDTPADLVKAALPEVLARRGLPAGEVTVNSSPDLTFVMDADGKRWRVTYNTLNGEIAGRPIEDAKDTLTTRSFLLRLHLAHGFPGSVSSRWFWAIAVDAMFVSMIFWGLSGLLMFWQIKAVRRWGIVVLLVSATIAVALCLGMHGEFTR